MRIVTRTTQTDGHFLCKFHNVNVNVTMCIIFNISSHRKTCKGHPIPQDTNIPIPAFVPVVTIPTPPHDIHSVQPEDEFEVSVAGYESDSYEQVFN